MDARTVLGRGISTGLRLGRGTADRVVSLASPPLSRVAATLGASRHRSRPPATTTTFTPSKKADPEPAPAGPPDAPSPNPAVVARNIAPQRPTAKSPGTGKPRSAPGAKLPPRRPRTS